MHVLGIEVPSGTLDGWRDIFVFPFEPLYFTPDDFALTESLPVTPRTRSPDLNFADAYWTYHVPAIATHMALVAPETLRTHPECPRIMGIQKALGRNQLYAVDFVVQVLGSIPEPRDVFETDDGPCFALRHDVWHSLSKEDQNQWLKAFIERDRENCLSSSLTMEAWEQIEQKCSPWVRELAGTFATQSGPNCFATTLSALARDCQTFEATKDLWLHPEPFFQQLQDWQYQPEAFDAANLPDQSALVFRDGSGKAQHACLHLTGGLVLNKDAQGWSAPRQIRTLDSLLQSWMQPDWTLQVYQHV